MQDPAPVASGVLQTTALTDTAVVLRSAGAGTGQVAVPWSRLLVIRRLDVPHAPPGCVRPSPVGLVEVTVPDAGTWSLHADLGLQPRQCREGTGTS